MDSQSSLPLFPAAPEGYRPRAVPHFDPAQIILSRGSLNDEERRVRVESICRTYPHAHIIERLDTPHNRITMDASNPLGIHYTGKQTLVLGEHRSAVRFSSEEGNTCPNYWHFSPYGFCPRIVQSFFFALKGGLLVLLGPKGSNSMLLLPPSTSSCAVVADDERSRCRKSRPDNSWELRPVEKTGNRASQNRRE